MVALSSLAGMLAASLSLAPFQSFHLIKVKEVYPGSVAAPNAQYVVLQMYAANENFVAGKEVRLFDSGGTLIQAFAFPANMPVGLDQSTILIATNEARTFFGGGGTLAADLVIPPVLPMLGGKVCFHDPLGFGDIDCMAWGGYSGSLTQVGRPANDPIGLMRGVAFTRRLDVCGAPTVLEGCDDTENNFNDFREAPPAPRNNAGTNGTIPASTCGNGAVQSIEQCDDGNLASGDGCTATCLLQRFPADPGFEGTTLVVDPAATGTSDGNRVLEPGEQVMVQPTWQSFITVAHPLTSAISRFTGPAGAAHSIVDGAADYGIVGAQAAATCTAGPNCLAVAVSAPNPRPSLHWDAVAAEVTSQYEAEIWRVHVGQSFDDVPRSSPFYRFVETILHRGVTGGCTASTYCPAATTTRETMAVFVLLAKEPLLSPPGCSTPLFNDVPAASPFCRWIEELARRGIVSGCGGGNYCPTAPVTRDQMAVFVLRTLDPALNPPACGTPVFADVPASSPFCRWVEELARRGVVSGCGGGNYCPAAAVTREQMGVFLTVTFGLTLYG